MSTLLTPSDLDQFTGDLIRYRNVLVSNVIYTPGVRHVAEHGGAYWLIDELALILNSMEFRRTARRDPRILALHFWCMDVHDDHSATLTGRADSDVPPFITREIPFTDFPLKSLDIWAGFSGQDWTLYLPSEH